MIVSRLNGKITIQKSVVIADDIGNRKNIWEDYHTCFATISGEDGTEKDEVGTTVEKAEIAFSVRYCKATSTINSTQYRIIFHEELYNIISVDHMNYKKKSMKFRCQKVRR